MESIMQELKEEGCSLGAVAVAGIVEAKGGSIRREELDERVEERPRLDPGKTGEILEKLEEEGKLAVSGKTVKLRG